MSVVLIGLRVVVVCMIGALCFGAGPKSSGSHSVGVQADRAFDDTQVQPVLDPDSFSCIILGDSQLSGPNSNGVRTQMHGWDSNFVGDLVTVGNNASGYEATMGNAGNPDLFYRPVDVSTGWGDSGPRDFFAVAGHEWRCFADIPSNGARIARYRLNFSVLNTDSPWDESWGVGENIVARIAIRNNPNSVRAIQTRPERGELIVGQLGRTHILDQGWGIQIIEQRIPASIDPDADRMGVGLFFPPNRTEEDGMNLQVLGVTFHKADRFWNIERGTFIGYQGRASFSVWDHIELFSQQSRVALIEMIDPDYIMIMLGHNTEANGFLSYEPGLIMLSKLWDSAFTSLRRPRPSFIFVSPWGVGLSDEQPYLGAANRVNERIGMSARTKWYVSLFDRYDRVSPEVFDPATYNMDLWHVHPQDAATGRRIAEDLYDLLFLEE